MAVIITPINTHLSTLCVSPSPKNGTAIPNPSASGTTTPNSATKLALSPERFNSFRSVSSPAPNIIIITPSSAKNVRNCDSPTGTNRPPVSGDQIAGPIKIPAIRAPTTCGNPNFFISNPNNFVAKSMIAKSNKKL